MCRNREIIHHRDEAVAQTNCRLCATYISRDQETYDPNNAPEIHLIVVSKHHHYCPYLVTVASGSARSASE